jgi:hypothetical protein
MAQTETGRTPIDVGSGNANSTQDDPRAVKLQSTAGVADPMVPPRNTNPADPQAPATAVLPDTPSDAGYVMSSEVARSQPSTFFPIPLGPLPLGTLGDPNLPILTQSPQPPGDPVGDPDPRATTPTPDFGNLNEGYPSNIHDGAAFAAQTNFAGNIDPMSGGADNPRPEETGGFLPQEDNSPSPLQPIRAQTELT